MKLLSTFGFDDTRTKPLSVIGHVSQPSARRSANQALAAAWWMCESHASATRAFTSSSAIGHLILVERAPDHLRRYCRRARRDADHGQVAIGLDPRRRQAATRELGGHRA